MVRHLLDHLLAHLLEHISGSWSPCNVSGVKRIEAVRRKFIKKGFEGWKILTTTKRLALFGAEALELRRLNIDYCVQHLV